MHSVPEEADDVFAFWPRRPLGGAPLFCFASTSACPPFLIVLFLLPPAQLHCGRFTLPQSKHFPLDITPSLPLLFSTSALPQFTFSPQQDMTVTRPVAGSALPQFTFSPQQDHCGGHRGQALLCHSSHSRLSKTRGRAARRWWLLCHSSHSRLSKTARASAATPRLLCHSSHSRLSKTEYHRKVKSYGFATVHILASARLPAERKLPMLALPQFTFSPQQDGEPRVELVERALPQFTFSPQQDAVRDPVDPHRLCHSSHSRLSKTPKGVETVVCALCHSSHSRLSKTPAATQTRTRRFATVHILASARPPPPHRSQ